jgi:colanic acid/amylovoran biosynthesis glycosyltransferase
VENKGIDFSIRALKLIDSRRAIEFHVVGDGPLRGPLSRLANEIGSGKTVIFHGSCSSAQVRKHLDKAHLFILAAVTSADGAQEGQSVALIEAQACGLPILSTFHGGIPEAVVNGASGFLVPERDIDSLSDRLRYLIENSEEWSAMGIAGRRFVEESFSLQSCSDKITNIYGSLISEHDRTAAHR